MANNVQELLESYTQRSQGYLNEMSSVEDQIHNINRDVDLAMIDISADCINQCKTGVYRSYSILFIILTTKRDLANIIGNGTLGTLQCN